MHGCFRSLIIRQLIALTANKLVVFFSPPFLMTEWHRFLLLNLILIFIFILPLDWNLILFCSFRKPCMALVLYTCPHLFPGKLSYAINFDILTLHIHLTGYFNRRKYHLSCKCSLTSLEFNDQYFLASAMNGSVSSAINCTPIANLVYFQHFLALTCCYCDCILWFLEVVGVILYVYYLHLWKMGKENSLSICHSRIDCTRLEYFSSLFPTFSFLKCSLEFKVSSPFSILKTSIMLHSTLFAGFFYRNSKGVFGLDLKTQFYFVFFVLDATPSLT